MAGSGKRAILIAGPTASGKSQVAITLAERLGGVVVNADAMQVYGDLRILTARPSAEDEARVPHRLFGHVDGSCAYSVGSWLDALRTTLSEAERDGRVPIIVGGTGLYFKALIYGLSAMPPIPPDLRNGLRTETAGWAPSRLHARLAARDPVMAARLRPTDPQRVLRALEVFEATGTSLSDFQARREPALLPPPQVVGVFLAPPRDALREAIAGRVDGMLSAGVLGEVSRMATRKLDPDLPVRRTLGLSELEQVLSGATPIAVAREAIIQRTAQYAKRQVTFARHQLPDLSWLSPETASDAVASEWEASSLNA